MHHVLFQREFYAGLFGNFSRHDEDPFCFPFGIHKFRFLVDGKASSWALSIEMRRALARDVSGRREELAIEYLELEVSVEYKSNHKLEESDLFLREAGAYYLTSGNIKCI
ncbi:hypothetical protein AVEN_98183-1 [Araneus ventricosus]|uniref:Uncharacterized protein n=1 Tax=Araneus ventricosus TaxID=182803 RepID=A0A4Y2GX56_ARAVE|nr:hypothetical protein AVEN_98183-1 [Araneus ventricosus]